MNILAENRFTVTKSLFMEGMLRVSRESYGKFAGKAVAFLWLLWLLLAALALWQRQSPAFVGVELVVVCFASLWIGVFLPRNKAKRAFTALENRGGGLERITRFYSDRLEVDASGTQKAILYSEIRQILTAKRLLILVTDDKTGIMLKRDGFLLGDEEDVHRLIRQAKAEN